MAAHGNHLENFKNPLTPGSHLIHLPRVWPRLWDRSDLPGGFNVQHSLGMAGLV